MSVASILGAIISRKRQSALTAGQRYHQLLKAVASGEEIDADDAADIVDGAGKSESDFERDVAIMQKRFSLVAQLQTSKQIQATIPGLEKAQADTQKKLNDSIELLRPIADAAARRLRDAQNSLEGVGIVEQQLMQTCLDPSLIARQQELEASRMSLVKKRQPLDDDLRQAKARLRGAEHNIENLEAAIAKNKTNLPAVAADKKDLAIVRSQAESLSETVSDLATAVDGINSELEPVEQELAAVRKAKLLP